MFCIHCGSELPAGAVFCPGCGTRAASKTSSQAWPSKSALPPRSCSSCGSTQLKRIQPGVYLCEHCGSRFYTDGQETPEEFESPSVSLALLLAEAEEHAGNGDSKGELLCLTKALSLAPEDETVVYRLARCYARLDLTEKAMEYYRKAVELNPGDPANQIGMGTALLNAGKPSEAKALYEEALSMVEADPGSVNIPTLAVAYVSYGLCLGRLGDRKSALKYFSLAKKNGFSQSSLDGYCRELNLSPDLI